MFDKPIEKMNFDELRSAVQVLYDAFAKQSREYADLLQNLDFDNLSPQVREAVNSTVSEETLGKFEESVIKQTAGAISTQVARMYDLKNAVLVYNKGDMEDTSLIYYMIDVDGTQTYYYYNPLESKWKPLEGSSIFTVFEQTADGFAFKGNVIVGGTIQGVEIIGGKFTSQSTSTGADIVIGADKGGNRGDISIGGVGHIYAVPFDENAMSAVYITADNTLLLRCGTFKLEADKVEGLGLPLVFS